MSDRFWIQASSPRWQGSIDPDATTIDEATESIFLRNTEDAFIVWQHVYIPLSYKYDVGTILVDVLEMVQKLLEGDSGEWRVNWPSNTFGADWHFKWIGDQLIVTALEWRSIVGDTEELLRNLSVVEISKQEFVSEWKALLERVHAALSNAGYTAKMIPELNRLTTTIARIRAYGVLYQ